MFGFLKKRKTNVRVTEAQIAAQEAIFNSKEAHKESLLKEALQGTSEIEQKVKYLEHLKEQNNNLKVATRLMDVQLDARYEEAVTRAKAEAAASASTLPSVEDHMAAFHEAMAKAESARLSP